MGAHTQDVYDPLQLSKGGSGSVKHIILSPTEYVISNLCIFVASGTNLDVVGCFLDMGKVVEIGHTFSFLFFLFYSMLVLDI